MAGIYSGAKARRIFDFRRRCPKNEMSRRTGPESLSRAAQKSAPRGLFSGVGVRQNLEMNPQSRLVSAM
jgi:hypothetical protein